MKDPSSAEKQFRDALSTLAEERLADEKLHALGKKPVERTPMPA